MPSLNLHLDDFGLEAMAAHAEGAGSVAGAATRHYLADRRSLRPNWQVPRFLPSIGAGGPPPTKVLLDEETWRRVPAEAALQRVTPEELVEHAVLYFLADLHRGRLAPGSAGDPLDAGR
jgi:hypothetical protein